MKNTWGLFYLLVILILIFVVPDRDSYVSQSMPKHEPITSSDIATIANACNWTCFLGFYVGESKFTEWMEFLSSHGYEMYWEKSLLKDDYASFVDYILDGAFIPIIDSTNNKDLITVTVTAKHNILTGIEVTFVRPRFRKTDTNFDPFTLLRNTPYTPIILTARNSFASQPVILFYYPQIPMTAFYELAEQPNLPYELTNPLRYCVNNRLVRRISISWGSAATLDLKSINEGWGKFDFLLDSSNEAFAKLVKTSKSDCVKPRQ